MFSPGDAIMCTPLSISVDLVYSVDRRFLLLFNLSNEMDTFGGADRITVAILENGNDQFSILQTSDLTKYYS